MKLTKKDIKKIIDLSESDAGFLVNERNLKNAVEIVLNEKTKELVDALSFCKSVIQSQGMFDLSERMAFDKAEDAIKKATE